MSDGGGTIEDPSCRLSACVLYLILPSFGHGFAAVRRRVVRRLVIQIGSDSARLTSKARMAFRQELLTRCVVRHRRVHGTESGAGRFHADS